MDLACRAYEWGYELGKEYDLTDQQIGTAMYCVVFLAAGIPFNSFLFAAYHFNWFAKYRIPRKKLLQNPKPGLVRKALLHHFVTYVVMLPFTAYFLQWALTQVGMKMSPDECPDWKYTLYYLVMCIFGSETIFYWAHRTFHHPMLYKRFHKQHHEFNATIGIAYAYASPVESIFANMSNVVIPALLLKGHIVCWLIWMIIRTIESIDAHSGFQFPVPYPNLWFASFPCITGGAERHDYHHSHNTEMYGSFTGFWDWVMGTDRQFMEHRRKRLQQ